MMTTIVYSILILSFLGILCAIVFYGEGQRFSINKGMPMNDMKVSSSGTEAQMAEANDALDMDAAPGNEPAVTNTFPCIRCARCIPVCVAGLEPYLLSALSDKQLWQRAADELIMQCNECGSCNDICPANRALLQSIQRGKAKAGGRAIYD